jgi:hypothetical protein
LLLGLSIWEWNQQGPNLLKVQPLTVTARLEAIDLSLAILRDKKLIQKIRTQFGWLGPNNTNVLIHIASCNPRIGNSGPSN